MCRPRRFQNVCLLRTMSIILGLLLHLRKSKMPLGAKETTFSFYTEIGRSDSWEHIRHLAATVVHYSPVYEFYFILIYLRFKSMLSLDGWNLRSGAFKWPVLAHYPMASSSRRNLEQRNRLGICMVYFSFVWKHSESSTFEQYISSSNKLTHWGAVFSSHTSMDLDVTGALFARDVTAPVEFTATPIDDFLSRRDEASSATHEVTTGNGLRCLVAGSASGAQWSRPGVRVAEAWRRFQVDEVSTGMGLKALVDRYEVTTTSDLC